MYPIIEVIGVFNSWVKLEIKSSRCFTDNSNSFCLFLIESIILTKDLDNSPISSFPFTSILISKLPSATNFVVSLSFFIGFVKNLANIVVKHPHSTIKTASII